MPRRTISPSPSGNNPIVGGSTTTIHSADSPATLEIDSASGLLTAIEVSDSLGIMRREYAMTVDFIVGGDEVRDPTGGLAYDNTEIWSSPSTVSALTAKHRGVCHEFSTRGAVGDLHVEYHYRLYPTSPYVEVAVTLSADDAVVLRNIQCSFSLDTPSGALLNVPGSMMKRNLPVGSLGDRPMGVSPLGGLRGSSGIISITQDDVTSVVWPTNPSEIADITLSQAENSLTIDMSLNVAAEVSPHNSVEVLVASLNLDRGDVEFLRTQWPDWASRYRLTSPGNPPRWMFGAGIYEAQIGTSYFWRGKSYSRYSEIRDLIADLARIRALGFTVIQLMPKQPYPSYNVHDYGDITTSYGDENELRELVALCHSQGMRVILDVLLHGVLDGESLDAAVKGILTGPLKDRLDEKVLDTFGSDVSDASNYWIAWSRHILDFAEYWRAGSPTKTPLQASNPEWFATDSSGEVQGVYTKAFDARNPSWQRYFREAMLNLVRETDVDGFRFDAPTYNMFANWAPWARSRAFSSPLGCVPLFVDMRRDLKALKPDALMYTEPSGHLLRRSMDVNYNYDEQWLVSALLKPGGIGERAVSDARGFMQWMEDRDDFLPAGSHTAHHIDSHDTFWWPEWGQKWRREQYPLAAVRALTATFLAIDGPYMMFTGGEEGIESTLSEILEIRHSFAPLWATRGKFDSSSDPTGKIVIVERGSTSERLVALINLDPDRALPIPRIYVTGWSRLDGTDASDSAIRPYEFIFLHQNLESPQPQSKS